MLELACEQVLLSFRRLLVVNIGVGPDPARDCSRGVLDRERTGDMPSPCSVRTPQAELDLILLSSFEGLGPDFGCRADVVGMDHLGPFVAGQVSDFQAAVGEDLFVEPIELSVRGRRPHLVRHRLRERLEPRLAFSHGQVGVAGFRDVARDRKQPVRLAVGITDQRDGNVPPSRCARYCCREALEVSRVAVAGCSHCRLGIDIALVLPEVRPGAAFDGAEIRDFHDPLTAFGHVDEVAVEIENLDAIA